MDSLIEQVIINLRENGHTALKRKREKVEKMKRKNMFAGLRSKPTPGEALASDQSSPEKDENADESGAYGLKELKGIQIETEKKEEFENLKY